MTYARLCEHGEVKAHPDILIFGVDRGAHIEPYTCPGGSVLPDDTLVIVKEDGKWPEWATTRLYGMVRRDLFSASYVLHALASAQGSQE